MKITCGIFLYETKSEAILIGHAARTFAANWSIPKGLKEEDEEDWTAAKREFKEETGIEIDEISTIEVIRLPDVKYRKQNKVLKSFLVVTNTLLNEQVLICSSLVNNSYPEIDEYKWVKPQELKDYVHETQKVHADLIKNLISNYK